MTGDDASPDVVTTAQALTASLNGMTTQLEALTSYGRRNRHMIWGLVASLLLDAILTAVIATVAVQANHASDRATQVHNQQIATCVSTNSARAVNVQLWDYLLALPPSEPRTEKQIKQLADFKTYVHTAFAPRDCKRI